MTYAKHDERDARIAELEAELARVRAEFWALIWRDKDDWGWLRSLDGNEECTTQEPGRRLRYASRERAMAALWKFRADNPPLRPGETVRVVRVRVVREPRRTLNLLRRVEASGVPDPEEHPTMWAAWQEMRKYLATR